MTCKFCFRDKTDNMNINIDYKKVINSILTENRIRYINIAGGEPTLYRNILDLLSLCKDKFDETSIITNGSLIFNDINKLEEIIKIVDVFGLSIDSLSKEINNLTGRNIKGKSLGISEVNKIIELCKKNNTKIKINIVINKTNLNDNSIFEINWNDIQRIKLLKNQEQIFNITDKEYEEYVKLFKKNIQKNEIILEPDMDNSYLMIDSNLDISVNKEKYNFEENSNKLNELTDLISKSKLYKKRY